MLRNPALAKRSFFYFRDPQLIASIPEPTRADYAAENAEAAHKLRALKDKIRSTGVRVTEPYPCHWDEHDNRVAGLDVFGHKVLQDLWTAICEEYPAEAPEADPLVVERHLHEAFVEERSHLHVGRTEQAAQVTRSVQRDERRPIVITGPSGCGKSAFLATWYRHYTTTHPNEYVLAYFIGASPDSTNHNRLLRNMCHELKRQFALDEDVPQDDQKLSDTLAQLLNDVTVGRAPTVDERLQRMSREPPGRRRVILLLDALDQLLPLEAARGLSWILDYIPANVHLVASSLEGECLEALRRRGAEEIRLPPLSAVEQQQIIQAVLATWGRKLDRTQLATLVAHPEAKNPLYLWVALEELRLFGSFEQLTQRITNLPSNVTELFGQVLMRLEADNGAEFVAEAFALLGCSRYGLREVELLDLLSSGGAGRLPRAWWTRLLFSAKMYLVQRGDLFGFFHRQLGDAVHARYLATGDMHAKLAEYFDRAPIDRRLDELPFQRQQAKQWEALAAALSDLDLFQYGWDRNRMYEWIGYWLSVKDGFQADYYYRTAIDNKIKAEGKTPTVASLSNRIGLLLSNMFLYPSATPFYKQALKIYEAALGPNHPDVAHSLNNLAALYHDQGRIDEALPLYQRALKIREAALGPNHPKTKTVQKKI